MRGSFRAVPIALAAAALACSTGVERTVPPTPSASAAAASSAAPGVAASASASVSAAAPPVAAPRFTSEEALALLYPEGKTLAELGCTAGDEDEIARCLIRSRYGDDAAGLTTALAFYDEFGSIPGVEGEHDMEGGFRGTIHIVPERPIGKYQTHFDWILAAQRDIRDVFAAIDARKTHDVRYRYKPIGWKFMRSVGRTTPSAYANDWRVGYNVSGSLNKSMNAVRDTMVHEIFHDNDGEANDWSRATLGALYDGIVAKCGTKIACLTPYTPMKTTVRGGTYYAFQPDNGDGVHEYAAELASRYYLETRAAIRGESFPDGRFKCGPEENAKSWSAIVDMFFGGVDLVPACK
ncbi:MAG: hypothetical protein U0414_01585 [Polyangiaceae bacterium]